LRSKSRDGVLEELVNLFPLEPRPRALLLDMLKQREKLGSTSVGKGVAIPHGRSVVVSRLMIACGRTEEGVDWDSADGKPVSLFFAIAAPPIEVGNLYHPTLARVVELVRDAGLRKRLLAAADAETFWQVIDDEATGE